MSERPTEPVDSHDYFGTFLETANAQAAEAKTGDVVVAARQVYRGLTNLIAAALLIEQGLQVIINDLEQRAEPKPDSPPLETP